MPLHAWNQSNFKLISEKFGLVLSVDRNTLGKKFLDHGKVLISTTLPDSIHKHLILKVGCVNFPIVVREGGIGVCDYVLPVKNLMSSSHVPPSEGFSQEVDKDNLGNLDIELPA